MNDRFQRLLGNLSSNGKFQLSLLFSFRIGTLTAIARAAKWFCSVETHTQASVDSTWISALQLLEFRRPKNCERTTHESRNSFRAEETCWPFDQFSGSFADWPTPIVVANGHGGVKKTFNRPSFVGCIHHNVINLSRISAARLLRGHFIDAIAKKHPNSSAIRVSSKFQSSRRCKGLSADAGKNFSAQHQASIQHNSSIDGINWRDDLIVVLVIGL